MADEEKPTTPEEVVEVDADPENPEPATPDIEDSPADDPPPEVIEEEVPEAPEPEEEVPEAPEPEEEVPDEPEPEEEVPEEPEEPALSPEGGAPNMNFQLGGMPITFEERQVPVVGLFLGSVVALMSAKLTIDEDSKYYCYAVSVGAVGMFTSTLAFAMTFRQRTEDKLGKYMAIFNFVWSILGACILTFGPGPFTSTGNGYFALWLMTLCSIRSMGVKLRDIEESAYDGFSLLGLGLASLILIIALSFELGSEMPYRGKSIYALMVAIASIIFVERLRDFDADTKSLVLTILAIAWIVAACLVTFDGPFVVTGNGFFAAWGGALTCLYAANDEFLTKSRFLIEKYIVQPFKRLAGLDTESGEVASDLESIAISRGTAAVSKLDLEGGETVVVDAFYEDRSTEEMFAVAIDMPGVDQDDVQITLDGASLTFSGISNPTDDGVSVRTAIAKTMDIDLVLVDTDKLTAVLEKGVLLVSAPKRNKEEIYKTRNIVIT